MTNSQINAAISHIKSAFQSGAAEMRVDQKIAKGMIINNESMILKGTVKHFYIHSLGLGIYSVTISNNVPDNGTKLLK